MALPKQNRLRSSRDFGKVHRKGKRASAEALSVRALKQTSVGQKPVLRADRSSIDEQGVGEQLSAPSSCFGISISKKVSKRAVVRNRIKRQLRAIIRDRLADIHPGWQVVIVVRASAVECDFADFLRELDYLLKRLSVISKS